MATFSKLTLSGSTDGRPIKVAATGTPGTYNIRLQRRAASEALPVKVCDSCFSTLPSAEPVCPICGFVFPPPARRELVTVDGTLQELTPQEAASQRKHRIMEESDCRSLEDLEKLGRSRGYKPGWARYRWNAREQRRLIRTAGGYRRGRDG